MVGRAALFTLIPFAAIVAGGSVAAFRPPGQRLASAVQHFAAGVVFAAVALELLPPVRERSAGIAVVGFSVGIAVMYGLRRVTERLEQRSAGGAAGQGRDPPSGLLATIALDVFVDGLVLGAGFALAKRTGVLLTIALTLELVFLGLAAAAALGTAGSSPRTIVTASAGLGSLLTIGASVGAAILGGASSDALAAVLSFGAVALMYLVTEELLTEAHEVPETPWATALFFVGFLVYLLISEVSG